MRRMLTAFDWDARSRVVERDNSRPPVRPSPRNSEEIVFDKQPEL